MKSILATSACLLVSLAARAQQSATPAPPAFPVQKAPATYQGCVSKVPNVERYVLATESRCMLLNGDFKAAKVDSHLVLLRGVLLEPSSMTPLTLKVEKTLEVREICTQSCKLQTPGSRGLHGNEKPGSEGGPPGVVNPWPR